MWAGEAPDRSLKQKGQRRRGKKKEKEVETAVRDFGNRKRKKWRGQMRIELGETWEDQTKLVRKKKRKKN